MEELNNYAFELDGSTQCGLILNHLKENKGITSLEAIQLYGITRLSARIHDLRDMGVKIISKPKKVLMRTGKTTTVSEYSLVRGN